MPDAFDRARAELYGADLDDFTEVRARLAAAARGAGGPAVAKQIQALRKPTRSAWTVNRFARTHGAQLADLFDLGDALREAQSALDGPQLRELTGQRRQVVEALVAEALSANGASGAGVRDEVRSTFEAALADPSVRAEVAAGVLVRCVHWSGFGDGPALNVVAQPRQAPPIDAAGRRLAEVQRREQERIAAEQARARQQADEAGSAADAQLGIALEAEKDATRTVRLVQDQLSDARRRLDEAHLDVRHARARHADAVKAKRSLDG